MKYVTLALALLVQSSCIGPKKQNCNMDDVDILFKQYAYLLQRSFEYDREHERFKYEVMAFVDTCTETLVGWDEPIKPFSHIERGEPILLHPYLFNAKQDRVIIMVLTKDKDMADKPVEAVRYVLGNKENDKWTFRTKKGHVRRFRYEGGHPLLSDTEMTLRVLRTLIDWGYMPVDEVKINDKFFDKDW